MQPYASRQRAFSAGTFLPVPRRLTQNLGKCHFTRNLFPDFPSNRWVGPSYRQRTSALNCPPYQPRPDRKSTVLYAEPSKDHVSIIPDHKSPERPGLSGVSRLGADYGGLPLLSIHPGTVPGNLAHLPGFVVEKEVNASDEGGSTYR